MPLIIDHDGARKMPLFAWYYHRNVGLMLRFVIGLVLLLEGRRPLRAQATSRSATQTTTTADRSQLLQRHTLDTLRDPSTADVTLTIDPDRSFQPIEGFGYTLTGGSALLIHQLEAPRRAALLEELFGDRPDSLRISYLRISIGASDLDREVFSYDDHPHKPNDTDFTRLDLAPDERHLLPLLQEILAIRPSLTIMATPWSAPRWMKTNGQSIGGSLRRECEAAYAEYFVAYVQAMQAQGIAIDAVTVQNEPENGHNNPSMVMTAEQQARFVRDHLGPAFAAAHIKTHIVIWDHNCDHPEYPLRILDDPRAKAWVHGTAFHLYGGSPAAMQRVHAAHPDRAIYFTEQWTAASGNFGGDLEWHAQNVLLGSLQHWSRTVLEWNLATDDHFGPHTQGGCADCQGALTITGDTINRNVSYYLIAHASRAIPPGSVRIASETSSVLPHVAFRTPRDEYVLLIWNDRAVPCSLHWQHKQQRFETPLPAKSLSTITF